MNDCARRLRSAFAVAAVALAAAASAQSAADSELRFWLENALWHHGYTAEETAAGLGLPLGQTLAEMKRFGIEPGNKPAETAGGLVKVLPWAPGRHPRIGFLEGAIDPQRDTKVSVFLPWSEGGFVVFDLPEAIFANDKLIYLAHTHVPTIWSEQGVALERVDWKRLADGELESERRLPNGVRFGAKVRPAADGIDFEYWLENGSQEKLAKIRSQLCLMLKAAPGFNAQTGENKMLFDDAAAARSGDGRRWIVTACERTVRTWQNPPVPCIHADPTFPDLAPGERATARGRVFFLEAEDVEAEIARRRADGTLYGSRAN